MHSRYGSPSWGITSAQWCVIPSTQSHGDGGSCGASGQQRGVAVRPSSALMGTPCRGSPGSRAVEPQPRVRRSRRKTAPAPRRSGRGRTGEPRPPSCLRPLHRTSTSGSRAGCLSPRAPSPDHLAAGAAVAVTLSGDPARSAEPTQESVERRPVAPAWCRRAPRLVTHERPPRRCCRWSPRSYRDTADRRDRASRPRCRGRRTRSRGDTTVPAPTDHSLILPSLAPDRAVRVAEVAVAATVV